MKKYSPFEEKIGKDCILIFQHLAKSGGSTLHTIIDKQYQKVEHFISRGPKDIKKLMNLSTKEKLGVIRGHMNFGIHDFLPKPSIYITMLREPVSRVISHYYYSKRQPGHFLYEEIVHRKMSLENFIFSTTENDNGQTRALAGISDVYSDLKKEQIFPFGECNSRVLETAKKNLNVFAVVGLLERFEETLILMKRTLGWKLPPLYVKENISPNGFYKENIPKETLSLIRKYNKLDIELYRYATNLFEEKINQQDASFEEELKDFKLLNKSYQEQQGFQQEHH